MLRPGAVVGRSTHSIAQARAAVNEGADYVSIGPIFETATKDDFLNTVQKSAGMKPAKIPGAKVANEAVVKAEDLTAAENIMKENGAVEIRREGSDEE